MIKLFFFKCLFSDLNSFSEPQNLTLKTYNLMLINMLSIKPWAAAKQWPHAPSVTSLSNDNDNGDNDIPGAIHRSPGI